MSASSTRITSSSSQESQDKPNKPTENGWRNATKSPSRLQRTWETKQVESEAGWETPATQCLAIRDWDCNIFTNAETKFRSFDPAKVHFHLKTNCYPLCIVDSFRNHKRSKLIHLEKTSDIGYNSLWSYRRFEPNFNQFETYLPPMLSVANLRSVIPNTSSRMPRRALQPFASMIDSTFFPNIVWPGF